MHSNLLWSPPFVSNFDFPSKKPTFKTLIQVPVSGRGEIRASLQPYPIWEITQTLNFARGGEQMNGSLYQYLIGFFIAMGGSFSDFLYTDPNDNTVQNATLGVGDGATVGFQLIRQIGIGNDIVQNPIGTPAVSVNGALASYTLEANGYIVMNSAPPAGTILSWSGSFNYRVRFDDDGLEFDQFMANIWQAKEIRLKSVIVQ